MLTNTRIPEIQRRAQTTFENEVDLHSWCKLLAHDILIDLIPEIVELRAEKQALKMKAGAWDVRGIYGHFSKGSNGWFFIQTPHAGSSICGLECPTQEEALCRAAVTAGILKEEDLR